MKYKKNRTSECKEMFESYTGHKYEKSIEDKLANALSVIGIHIDDLNTETDPSKLRLILSELILKRNVCRSIDSKDYFLACNYLFCFIESFDTASKNINKQSKTTKQNTRKIQKNDKTNDSLTVALFFSKFNEYALKELGYKNYRVAWKTLGEILGQKPATIKNMRDEFDPYFDNERKGWYQKALVGSRKEIYEQYKDTSKEQLKDIVKFIISSYSNSKDQLNMDKPVHKRIKITSSTMKEIKKR